MPSKLTAIGTLVGIISLVLALLIFAFEEQPDVQNIIEESGIRELNDSLAQLEKINKEILLKIENIESSNKAIDTDFKIFNNKTITDIKSISAISNGMLNDVKIITSQLGRLLKTYEKHDCKNNKKERGCTDAFIDIKNKYSLMIEGLDNQMPLLRNAIENSRNGIRKSILAYIKQKNNPDELESLLRDLGVSSSASVTMSLKSYAKMIGTGEKENSSNPPLSDTSNMERPRRLSEIFKSYRDLIKSYPLYNGSLIKKAAGMYLDYTDSIIIIDGILAQLTTQEERLQSITSPSGGNGQ